MIKEAYVSFEVAKLLKEKGFDYDGVCNHYYKASNNTLLLKPTDRNIDTTYYSAPTHQMALAWLREKGYCIEPYVTAYRYGFTISKIPTGSHVSDNEDCYPNYKFENYEVALEAALKYLLKYLI